MPRVSRALLASRAAAPALIALFVVGLSVLPYFGGAPRTPAAAAPPARSDRRPADIDGAREALVSMPMLFESNEGQADPGVRFISRGDNYTLSLTSEAALLTLDGHEGVLSMRPLNARRGPSVRGGERAKGRVNYFVGRGRARGVTNVPVYESVVYGEVYPGIDLVYYGNGRQLEYDFRLAPGASPEVIEMSFGGADGLEVSEGGDLLIHASGRRLVQKRPAVYQEEGASRVEVAGRYVLKGENSVGFEVGEYDANRPLVIDPVLSHATYGVSAADIKLDAAGNLYMIGGPRGGGAASPGGPDIVVSKFAPADGGGLSLVYTTHFGGGGFDGGGVAVARSGEVYVAGVTNSTDFPVTPDALQPKLNRGTPDNSDSGTCCRDTPPQDAFVARLGASGELLYASYFGGSGMDSATGPLVDAAGNLYLVGEAGPTSNNFPVTADAYMPTRPAPAADPRDDPLFDSNARKYDLYVAKLSPRGNGFDLAYSSYFGGNRADRLGAATVDAAGNVYLTGATGSTDFPVTANAVRSTIFATPRSVPASTPVTLYVTRFRPSAAGAAAVPYSTYVAGAILRPRDIAVDDAGRVYLLSRDLDGDNCNRQSPENVALCDSVPVTAGAMQGSRVGGGDVVLMKLDPTAPPRRSSLVYSTYFGGTAEDDAFDMELDEAGNVYLAGRTFSTDFPVTPGVFQTAFGGGSTNDLSAPGGDGFLAKIDSAGASLVYFTYLGGGGGDGAQLVRRDVRGNLYVAGWTLSGDFPVTDGSAAGGANTFSSFLARVSPDAVASEARVPLDASRARDPLGDASKFVRQHYLDFLSREPDARGLAHWTGEIAGCGADAQCREVKRINVSAAFFLSIEFQRTGYLVYRAYKAAYGRVPLYDEFSPDARAISAGVAVGSAGWEGQIEANEKSFLDSFAARPQFGQLYDGLSDGQYVDALFANAGVTPTPSERESLLSGLRDGSVTRAGALGKVANGEAFTRQEKSRAFVLMQYFGYLRRNPDEAGLNYWLGKLDEHGGNYVEAESVKAFLDSIEYHDRFKTVPRLGT